MGLYSTYGSVQLKVNEDVRTYQVGDNCPLEDGIYVGREGIVVILDGVFLAEYKTLTDKYGNDLGTLNNLGTGNV